MAAQHEQLVGKRQRQLDAVDGFLDMVQPFEEMLFLLRGGVGEYVPFKGRAGAGMGD